MISTRPIRTIFFLGHMNSLKAQLKDTFLLLMISKSQISGKIDQRCKNYQKLVEIEAINWNLIRYRAVNNSKIDYEN